VAAWRRAGVDVSGATGHRARVAATARRLFGLEALLPELRSGHDGFFRLTVALRVVLGVALTAALVGLMVSSGRPFAVVALAAVLSAPATPLLWRSYRRLGLLHPAFAPRDVVMLGVFVLLEPHFLALAMLFALASVAYTAFTAQRATSAAVAWIASASMVTASVAARPHEWVALGLVFPVVAFAIHRSAGALAGTAASALATNERVADQLGVVMWEWPLDGAALSRLQGDAQHLYGHPRERFLAEGTWASLLHPEDRGVAAWVEGEARAGRDYRVRYRLLHGSGAYVWLEEVATVHRDADGTPVRVSGITFDVTREVLDGATGARLGRLVDELPVAATVFHLADPDDPRSLVVVSMNPMADRLSEVPYRPGERFADLVPAAFDGALGIGALIADSARHGTSHVVREVRVRDRTGARRTVTLRMAPLPDHHVAVVGEDVTDLFEAQRALERQAFTDELTGLANRNRLRDLLAAAPVGTAVVILDLDLFKNINDAFGHAVGDQVLVEVGRLLVDAVESSTVARLGGDEFGFVVAPDRLAPEEIGRRIQAVLSRPIVLGNGLTLQTAGSLGIAVRASTSTSAEELLRQADVAMYRAKRSRGGSEVYRPTDDTSAPHRMMLLGEVRRAMRNRELELHYQPIVDCRTGRVLRLEALLRWRHPALGLLPPAEFVELTELNTLNADVVLHTLDIAVADATRLRDAGAPVAVSVNAAGASLHDVRLVDAMVERIAASGLAPHAIGIELTERQLALGTGVSTAALERLDAAGCWLSIDDFGTGTSSLAALRSIAAHEVKIDRSFVEDLRRGDSRLIGSIVAMAHELRFVVVAEGVEDEVTLRWLRDHGADRAQGYHVAPPLPLAAFEPELLRGEGRWRRAT